MAIKPLVLVFQELRAPTANIINPTLSGCVIGPHYHVKTYAEHKAEIFAGKYDYASGVTVLAMPASVPGMKLKSAGFRLWFDKARVIIDSGVAGTIGVDGVLTGDPGENFTSVGTNVKAGDTLKITHAITMAGAATGDGAGANPERITVTGLAGVNVEVGDLVSVASAGYTGQVTGVFSTYIEVEAVLGGAMTFTGVDIEITRIRVVRNATTGQTYAVKSVNSATGIQLTTSFPFAASNVAYEITRQVNQAEITAGYTLDTNAGTLAIAAGATTMVDNIVRTITAYDFNPTLSDEDEADIYTEYTALDVSFAYIPARIEKNADIDSQLGVTDPRNPLGLGALVMFGNSQAVTYAIGLESEDTIGWAKAVDAVNRGKFYAQALLTQDASIVGMFKANNVTNEAPEIAQYGLAIGNHDLPDTIQAAGSSVGAVLQDPGNLLYTIFEDLTANFLSTASPVLPGDTLTVLGVTHIIDQVISGNRVKLVVADAFAGASTGVTYTITRELSKDQQAAAVAAVSTALKNKRVIMTFPNLCVYQGEEVSGFYLNCVTAGLISGLPSQAGITNKGAALIDKVVNTNWDYFTESQIDVIAAGGTLVFAQEDPNGLPFVRHQLTTDPALLETGEISVVKNNDFLSLFFKGVVKPYLGDWNVTEDLIDALTIAISQGIEFQKGNKVAKIGAPLIDATIETLKISDISPDRVEIYLGTTQPKPLNTIGLHMIL